MVDSDFSSVSVVSIVPIVSKKVFTLYITPPYTYIKNKDA